MRRIQNRNRKSTPSRLWSVLPLVYGLSDGNRGSFSLFLTVHAMEVVLSSLRIQIGRIGKKRKLPEMTYRLIYLIWYQSLWGGKVASVFFPQISPTQEEVSGQVNEVVVRVQHLTTGNGRSGKVANATFRKVENGL